jgi:hypothetical protein
VATIPGGSRSRPMPMGTTYLFAAAPFMTSKAKLREFVQTTLGPTTLKAASAGSPRSSTVPGRGDPNDRWAGGVGH